MSEHNKYIHNDDDDMYGQSVVAVVAGCRSVGVESWGEAMSRRAERM